MGSTRETADDSSVTNLHVIADDDVIPNSDVSTELDVFSNHDAFSHLRFQHGARFRFYDFTCATFK